MEKYQHKHKNINKANQNANKMRLTFHEYDFIFHSHTRRSSHVTKIFAHYKLPTQLVVINFQLCNACLYKRVSWFNVFNEMCGESLPAHQLFALGRLSILLHWCRRKLYLLQRQRQTDQDKNKSFLTLMFSFWCSLRTNFVNRYSVHSKIAPIRMELIFDFCFLLLLLLMIIFLWTFATDVGLRVRTFHRTCIYTSLFGMFKAKSGRAASNMDGN